MTHLAIHRLDRVAWSAPTICGKIKRKRDKVTMDVKLVDCPGCRSWVECWTVDVVRKLFDDAEGI